jgi:tetratricopeptide (TPR) repeat protein
LVLRGEVYLFDSDNERAIQDAEKALAFDPNNSDAYLVLVKAYLNQKEYDSAITKAKEAARLAPWSAEPYGYMGEAYMQKTLFDDAITNLKKAIELDPEDINARWLLYQAHLEIGDFDSVHTDLDDLLKYKDQLTSDQLDKAEADLVFVETIPPAVNGKRTVKDSTNNYTLTYSTDWRPEKTTSVDQALYLSHQDYPDDVKLTVFASRLGSGDPSNIPPYIFADAMKEAFKAMPGYQFIARKTFRAYGATGIADTFSYQVTTDKGRMTMMTKIFFFVKGKDVIMIIYMTTPNLFDRYEPAVDEIAGTFRFLK